MKNSIPYVRYADKRFITNYDCFVQAYDYRLFYVISGELQLITEKCTYVIAEKSLIIIPPAVKYKIAECKKDTLIYILNFDLDSNNSDVSAMSPDRPESFDIKRVIIPARIDFCEIYFEVDAFFVEALLNKLYEESEKNYIYSDEIKDAYLKLILLYLIREKIKEKTPGIIGDIKKYIEKNCLFCPSNEEMATYVGYHPLYLNRIFKQHTGKTLHAYQLECRLKEAEKLILSSDKNICEIAEITGFDTAEYFTKVYKKHFGHTPTQARKKLRML